MSGSRVAGGLPGGVLAFLLTDLEASTRLWEEHPGPMARALARHDALVERAIEEAGGRLRKTRGEGDSTFSIFPEVSAAVRAALAVQCALGAEPWPPETPLRARIAVHTGEAEERDGDYFGPTVNRCARLRSVAHGGQVLLSEAAAELARATLPEGASLVSLGVHRLRDLSRPEEIWQLAHPGIPAGFPPLRSLDVALHNLPAHLSTFIGREREMAAVRDDLSRTPLVTLTGPGGVGKSRLALQVAADSIEASPGGVWLAELAPLRDPRLVPAAVAAVLGLREEPGRALEATITAHLAERTVLLVLDNCEHLLEAVAALANTLLASCRGVRVLATSRGPLGVPGEIVRRVPPLAVPGDAPRGPGGARAESVRLFADRAALARPGFRLTAETESAAARICAQLEGMPLAIELAAARAASLGLDEIERRLSNALSLLAGVRRGGLEHHRSLRAAIEWSHESLAPAERALFRRLAVFAGPFALADAEAVCAGRELEPTDVLDSISRLVDSSLVQSDEADATMLFRLLETVRQLAWEKLDEAGETAWARDRHLWHVAARVRDADERLRGVTGPATADAIDAGLDGIRAALGWAVDERADPQTGLRIAIALARFWVMRGHLTEGRGWLERAYEAASPEGTPDALDARIALGSVALGQGDGAGAASHSTEGLRLARAAGEEGRVPMLLLNLGVATTQLGRAEEAQAIFEQCTAAARSSGDEHLLMRALTNLGRVRWFRADLDGAKAIYAEALACARRLQDQMAEMTLLQNLGEINRIQGNTEAARGLVRDALERARLLGYKAGLASAWGALGNIEIGEGDHDRARGYFRQSLAVAREMGNAVLVATTVANLAIVAEMSGDLDGALAGYEEYRRLSERLSDRRGVARALRGTSDVLRARGALEDACASLTGALAIERDFGDQVRVAECLESLGALALAHDDPAEAGRALFAADRIRGAVGAPRDRPEQEAHDASLARCAAAIGEAGVARLRSDAAATEAGTDAARAIEWLRRRGAPRTAERPVRSEP